MNISEFISADSFVIDGYGDGQFCIRGVWRAGAQIVFPDGILSWTAETFEGLSLDDFAPILQRADRLDILLLGTGPRNRMIPKAIRQPLREAGVVVDGMDTGAACRTYNVLLSEGRRIAAALLPV